MGFIGFVVAMLLIDLKFFHTDPELEPTIKESGFWVALCVSLALIFGAIVFWWRGVQTGIEYFTGYIIEYSLSVDNMFVFVVIFSYFRVPFAYQHQVLFYGILGAMIFRGIFIALGAALIANFSFVIYIFGAFLFYAAWRIWKGTEEIHPEDNPVLKFVRKRFRATNRFDGQKLFTIENGKRVATPLFVTLIFIEFTDIVFAIDSIPAIFGITHDPFIVLTSNVFAILGLRALYFLLAGTMDRFHLLNYGLAIVLAFVGAKMVLTAVPCSGEWLLCDHGNVHIPVWLSLIVVVAVLGTAIVLSLKIPPPAHEAEELQPEFPDPQEAPQLDGSGGESATRGERGG